MLFTRLTRTAFTIVELLVATAITALIVVLLGTMFGSLTQTTSRVNQTIDAFRDARAALHMIERELAGVVKSHQTAYFALDKRWQDPSDAYSNATDPNPNRQLFALVSMKNRPPGNPTPVPGDICAVGYYCRWEGNRYTLRRFFRDSVDTYNAIKPQLTGGTLTYTNAAALYSPSANDDLLASYIWNLQITPYKSDGTPDINYPLVIDPGNPIISLPAAIEVSFDAMSPEAARTIIGISTSPADWMDPTSANYVRLIAPHVYKFRARISL